MRVTVTAALMAWACANAVGCFGRSTFPSGPRPAPPPIARTRPVLSILANDYNRALVAVAGSTTSGASKFSPRPGGEVVVADPTGAQRVRPIPPSQRLSDLLAGEGTGNRTWPRVAVIRSGGRDGAERIAIISDADRLIRYGDRGQDLTLRDGDEVFVPFENETLAEELFAALRVRGEVVRDLDTILALLRRLEEP